MTQKEFIEVLDEKGYSYEMEGNKVIVTYKFYVDLTSLTSLPPDVVFSNGGEVWLSSLTSIPRGVVFKNVGNVYLEYLTGGWIMYWRGNIEGIDPKRLLNKMISLGLFEKRR